MSNKLQSRGSIDRGEEEVNEEQEEEIEKSRKERGDHGQPSPSSIKQSVVITNVIAKG